MPTRAGTLKRAEEEPGAVRAPLVALVVLASGCLGTNPAPPGSGPDEPARAFEGCARLLVLPRNATVRTYASAEVDLALWNCGDAPLTVTPGDPCDWHALNVTLRRGGDAWVLRQGSATPGGGSGEHCSDASNLPRTVGPGEWLNESVVWNGTVTDAWASCAFPCDPRRGARPMEPGAYRLVARAGT